MAAWFSLACSLITTLKTSQLRREIHILTGSHVFLPSIINSSFIRLSRALRTWGAGGLQPCPRPTSQGPLEQITALPPWASAFSSVQWERSPPPPSPATVAKNVRSLAEDLRLLSSGDILLLVAVAQWRPEHLQKHLCVCVCVCTQKLTLFLLNLNGECLCHIRTRDWRLNTKVECTFQPPSALQEGVKGLETVRFCFSAASNHKMLTKQQENYIDPIPKIDQNRREILTGRQEQKAESSSWPGFISTQSILNISALENAR